MKTISLLTKITSHNETSLKENIIQNDMFEY